jgi:hypothetical protein
MTTTKKLVATFGNNEGDERYFGFIFNQDELQKLQSICEKFNLTKVSVEAKAFEIEDPDEFFSDCDCVDEDGLNPLAFNSQYDCCENEEMEKRFDNAEFNRVLELSVHSGKDICGHIELFNDDTEETFKMYF